MKTVVESGKNKRNSSGLPKRLTVLEITQWEFRLLKRKIETTFQILDDFYVKFAVQSEKNTQKVFPAFQVVSQPSEEQHGTHLDYPKENFRQHVTFSFILK